MWCFVCLVFCSVLHTVWKFFMSLCPSVWLPLHTSYSVNFTHSGVGVISSGNRFGAGMQCSHVRSIPWVKGHSQSTSSTQANYPVWQFQKNDPELLYELMGFLPLRMRRKGIILLTDTNNWTRTKMPFCSKLLNIYTIVYIFC